MTIRKAWLAGWVVVSSFLLPAQAEDYYWTNTGSAGLFFETGNWGPSFATVPGAADNANFTNGGAPTVNWTADSGNSSALFNTTNNTVTLAIGAANTWLVTNRFIVGQNAGRTAAVTQASGRLVVSNDTGTASLIVGQAGKGAFTLSSGSVFANQLLVTNSIQTRTNSTFAFNGGTLTTSNMANQVAASIVYGSDTTFNVSGVWNMTGGSNLVDSVAGQGAVSRRGALALLNGAQVAIDGNAVLQVGGASGIAGIIVGNSANGCRVVVTNGGALYTGASPAGSSWVNSIGGIAGGNRNSAVVTGTNSAWISSASIDFGIGASNSLTIANGGTVTSPNGGPGGAYARILVTDPGSSWWLSGSPTFNGGVFSSFVVSNGAALVTAAGNTGTVGGSSNAIVVTGSGSVWSNLSGPLYVTKRLASYNSLVVADGGKVLNNGSFQIAWTYAGDTGATGNWVQVTGPGSVLSNAGPLAVSAMAQHRFNSLLIDNGGTVYSAGGQIGNGGASSDIVALASGALWDLRNGLLTWGSGATATGNALTVDSTSWITNVGGLSLNEAGLAVYLTNQTMNGMNVAFSGGALNIGTGPNPAPPSLIMRDYTLNAVGRTNGGPSAIGNLCSNTTVSLLSGSLWNGGNQALTLGSGAKGTNNVLLIDGQGVAGGAVVTNMNVTTVGLNAGSGWNTLIITNGGRLFSGGGAHSIGSTSPGNRVCVTGGGAMWNLGGQKLNLNPNNALLIDGQGVAGGAMATNIDQPLLVNSLLLVTNGGRFICNTSMTIGNGANNTTVKVVGGGPDGAAAALLVPGFNLAYAAAVTNNTLIIDGAGVEAGAVVSTASGGGVSLTIGSAVTSRDNAVIVTNKGRLYLAGGTTLNIIGYSTNNLLLVADGGKVIIGAGNNLIIGYESNTSSNGVIVRGVGSVLDFTGGSAGATIGSGAGGAQPVNQRLTGNYMVVDDSGVVTNGAFALATQSNCYNSTLMITNGGKWYAGNSTRGFGFGGARSTGNVVTVTGTGSLLDLAGNALPVGAGNNSNNWLTIDQGGTVDNIGTLTVAGAFNAVNLRGGTLGAAATTYTNGLFTVGDGLQAATLKSLAGGTLAFNSGVLITTNATLAGVGTVSGGAVGVIVTNGGVFTPGVNGAGTLTIGGSNLTWEGGGIYDCEITNLNLGFGWGWDVLNVSSQLVFAGGSSNFVIKMDSKNAAAAGFNPALSYALKIVSYGGITGYDTNLITLSTNNFQPAGYVWTLANSNNALWLVYNGSNPTLDANLVWKVPSNGNWSVGGNWAGGTAPAAAGDPTNVLNFGDNGTPYNSSNNLAGTFQLNKLVLANVSGVTNIIRGNPLSFTVNGAVAPRADYQSGGGSFVISNALSLGDGMVFGGEGGGTLVLASNVTGGQPLLKQGPWTLALAASNQFANPVVITNAGVVRWDNNSAFSTNNVTVSEGGTLLSTAGILFGAGGYREARVTGSGSFWTNAGTLAIGSNATVTVDNGGRLAGATTVDIGTTGSNSTLIVTAGGAVSLAGVLSVGKGANNNTLAVTNGGQLLSSANAIIGNAGSSSGNAALLSDAGSVWNLGGQTLTVGSSGTAPSFNTLTVANGAALTNGSLYIGSSSAGISNRMVIDNATYFNNGTLYVGSTASSNTLTLLNGARIIKTDATTANAIGRSGGSYNQVLVGAGCVWNNNSRELEVGVGPKSANNLLWIEGSGAAVMNLSAFYVGGSSVSDSNSLNNSVVVTNNGLLVLGATGAIIGSGNGVYSNSIAVSAGGTLNAQGYPITIGLAASTGTWANTLMAGDGGVIANVGTLTLGNARSTNNQLQLSGGSVTVSSLMATNALNGVLFSAGTLNLKNAMVSNGAAQVVGSGSQSATLNLLPGGTNVFVAGLVVTNGASLTGSGLMVATTTVFGTLSPGAAGIGAITNNGDFILKPGATTTVKLASANPGAGWDLLTVTNGLLQVNGTLSVLLTGGFTPTNTQSYIIMTNQGPLSVSGTFASGSQIPASTNLGGRAVGYFHVSIGPQGVALDSFAPSRVNPGTVLFIR